MKQWIRGPLYGMLLIACTGCGVLAGLHIAPSESVKVDSVQTTAFADPVSEFREERKNVRQMQISQLNEIIHSANAEDEIITMAQSRLMDLLSWSELETTLEGALRMRGFDDAVATIHEDSVSIFLRSEAITQQQTAVIWDLVAAETGFSGGNVKIIPIN